jgi:hypothetical protein
MNGIGRVRVLGPLALHADGVRSELSRLGYAPGTAENHVGVMAHLSQWMADQVVGLPSHSRSAPLFRRHTLVDWYHTGEDVQARLPSLATYLGHVEPRSTYWYLSGAPELLGLAAGRLEAFEEARP